jgi:hypothetical protein
VQPSSKHIVIFSLLFFTCLCDDLQAAAAGALRNLAVNEELEEQLLAAGCVPVLLQLAARPQEDVGVRTAALEGLR